MRWENSWKFSSNNFLFFNIYALLYRGKVRNANNKAFKFNMDARPQKVRLFPSKHWFLSMETSQVKRGKIKIVWQGFSFVTLGKCLKELDHQIYQTIGVTCKLHNTMKENACSQTWKGFYTYLPTVHTLLCNAVQIWNEHILLLATKSMSKVSIVTDNMFDRITHVCVSI